MARQKEVAGVAVEKGLLAAIKTAAVAERRTLSSFCELLLEDGFKRYKERGSALPLPTKPDFEKHVEVVDGEVKRKRGVRQRKSDRAASR